jgi:hypothetical protein
MILSKAHKFIFVKGVKVAGTSVEIALAPLCGPDDIITPITPIDERTRLAANAGARNYASDRAVEIAYLDTLRRTALADLPKLALPPSLYFNHMPLREVLRLEGPAVSDYRVLCVERNPYAKILSWANHQLSFDAYQAGGAMRSDRQAIREFLAEAIDNKAIVAVRNIERYRGLNGVITAKVMRFERLANDFSSLVRELGVESVPSLPHAKKGILADELDPREFFTHRHIALVNEVFGEEFETFQYERL